MGRGDFMAYFLKKSNLKKGTYLQIYESFYDPRKKNTAHRSYKALGYVRELQEKGIEDPVAFFKDEVSQLNQQLAERRQNEKDLLISEETPEKLLGYFPLKNLNDSLDVKKYIDLMQTVSDFKFNVFSLLSSLIYSRAACPCSKAKTFDEVLPKLYEPAGFSLNQLYTGLEYLGSEYEKVIEIYNHQISRKYPFDTSMLISTAQTFTLRSTERMISAGRGLPKRIEKIRLLEWASCLMPIRSRSG